MESERLFSVVPLSPVVGWVEDGFSLMLRSFMPLLWLHGPSALALAGFQYTVWIAGGPALVDALTHPTPSTLWPVAGGWGLCALCMSGLLWSSVYLGSQVLALDGDSSRERVLSAFRQSGGRWGLVLKSWVHGLGACGMALGGTFGVWLVGGLCTSLTALVLHPVLHLSWTALMFFLAVMFTVRLCRPLLAYVLLLPVIAAEGTGPYGEREAVSPLARARLLLRAQVASMGALTVLLLGVVLILHLGLAWVTDAVPFQHWSPQQLRDQGPEILARQSVRIWLAAPLWCVSGMILSALPTAVYRSLRRIHPQLDDKTSVLSHAPRVP